MPFTGYRITSPFGIRNNPFGAGKEFHTGIDLVKNHKAPINAFTEGQVLYAGFGNAGTGLGGYGNVVVVKDKNGRAQVYAHLDSVAVRTGATIKKGQVIGYQGTTGQVTGSHLHYEVRKGSSPSYGWIADRANNCLDPTAYLKSFYNTVSKPASKPAASGNTYQVTKATPGYITASDAKSGKNKKANIKAGTYYVFNIKDGMINVTSKNGTPGSWINPNKSASGATTLKSGQKVKVKSTAKKYATGQNIPSWVKGKTYTIEQVKSDRVLLKEIKSWVKVTDVQ
ncbi:M23 family metallopeptidase [Psychrobacillus sp.]|uniref:M23 family metallopeptidase n=1 Tax=Psychrobacillus sp. TaxID=1871623 RepID=UPI0028BD2E98|nr:M23 family metallopeptidase [Psychrobacillus sp.]